MKIQILNFRRIQNGKFLKALVDISIDGIIIRSMRVNQDGTGRPWVDAPMLSWKDPQTKIVKHQTIISFPGQLASEISNVILQKWYRVQESKNEQSNP